MTREIIPTADDHERRALDTEELELAEQTRRPAVGQLSDRALADVVARLRARRDRAKDIAHRQGREARAKVRPAGAAPARGNAGMLTKVDYLNEALARAIQERAARAAGDEGKPSQAALAAKAMALKEAGASGANPMMEEGGPLHPDDPDASAGKGAMADTARRTAPSGALDHAGELPSRERSRTRY